MRFLSLFAGIGGFDLGLERAGMKCIGQVENDPYCIKVLEKHWPDVPRWGDIRDVTAETLVNPHGLRVEGAGAKQQTTGARGRSEKASRPEVATHPTIDLICGGFPLPALVRSREARRHRR